MNAPVPGTASSPSTNVPPSEFAKQMAASRRSFSVALREARMSLRRSSGLAGAVKPRGGTVRVPHLATVSGVLTQRVTVLADLNSTSFVGHPRLSERGTR